MVINLVGQLGAVAMVLTRYKVDIACGVLFFIVVLQVNLELHSLTTLLTKGTNPPIAFRATVENVNINLQCDHC